MKIWLIVLVSFPLWIASPAHAQNCWWTGFGFQCNPGWGWRDGRARREDRREEWWRERRHHDDDERHHEWCHWHRC